MSIGAGSDALASDFISSSAGAGDSGKVAKLNASGKFDDSFLPFVFGGDGSDGVKTVASSENLDFNSANVLIKQYSSLTINAGQTLGATNVPSNGGVLWIKVSGNATINGTISMAGHGGNKGAGGAAGTNNGAAGTQGYKTGLFDTSNHYGGGGTAVVDKSGGGGGGAGHQSVGIVGTTAGGGGAGVGGTLGAALVNYDEHIDQNLKAIFFACGSGGGGGGSCNEGSEAGGDGGDGGGVVILEVFGNLTFGAASVITVAGNNGSNGAGGGNSGAGGGGGGSGGQIYVLYNGTLTDNGVTKTVSGGTAGTGGAGASDAGGDGGNGGAGDSYVAENLQF